MSRTIEGLVHETRVAIFGSPTKDEEGQRRQEGSAVEQQKDCDVCRYTGSGLCGAAGVYLLVQRHRQAQHRPFLLGMASGCFALGVARWFV